MLEDAAVPRYGLEISKQADLETGTLYPVMARLERVGWVESSWEDPDLSTSDGRPRRRYYQLTKDGAEQARLALAEISFRREERRSSPALAGGSPTWTPSTWWSRQARRWPTGS